MSDDKKKSARERLKEFGAESMPAKPDKDLRKDMQNMPGTPGKDLREGMIRIPKNYGEEKPVPQMKRTPKDFDNEEAPKMQKLKSGGSTSKWIQSAIKKPGALREQLGIKGKKPIPAKMLDKATKAPGKLGQRARLAKTLKGMK